MSEEDRAAKAARAKALLKKRQQKKAADSAGTAESRVTSPGIPSRTSTPVIAEAAPVEQAGGRDIGDVFSGSQDTTDTSWLTSLTRVGSPPPGSQVSKPEAPDHQAVPSPTSPPKAAVSSPDPSVSNAAYEAVQQQLVTVKSHLTSLSTENESLKDTVRKLQNFEAAAQQTEASLLAERKRSEELKARYERQAQEALIVEQKRLQELRGNFEEEKEASVVAERQRLEELLDNAKEEAENTLKQSLQAARREVEELRNGHQEEKDELELALQNERRTVSLLVTEKAHLTAELGNRDDLELKVQELEDLLGVSQAKAKELDSQVVRLEAEVRTTAERAERSESKEKEISEKFKEQERQLQITTASASELRKEADEVKRKLRELEEQIQNDDRVERLEKSLKHTQDRADELEFQLTKLKQAHTALKSERDSLESQLSDNSSGKEEYSVQITELKAQLAESTEKYSALEKERDEIDAGRSKLQALTAQHEVSIKEHQERLTQAAAVLATNARQLQTAQHELKNALKRAEDSEKVQKHLQAEGTNLMQSLDTMRPKIVELTDTKLELAEKVENLEHTLRNRDAFISQLENDLGEARGSIEETETIWKEKVAEQEKKHREVLSGSSDIQKAYAELQEELNTTLASLRSMETQRTKAHQDAARRLEEIRVLKEEAQSQGEELDTLRTELEARRNAHDEEQDFLESAQEEVEALRADLAARESEIEQLRDLVNSPVLESGSNSLDDEMLRSLRQQHALDLSAATSQIRALEQTIFDKESANHRLQKQLSALEDQLAKTRPAGTRHGIDVSRRTSSSQQRPGQPRQPLSRTLFDQVLSADTVHKRQVSLSMLKARIDSEMSVVNGAPSRAFSPVQGANGGHSQHSHSRSASGAAPARRPQFLDESHVFWCASCTGDLVIL